MSKPKSTFELSSLNPLHKKYSNNKSSTRSRKGSIFSLSSDVVPQTLDVNHQDTTNPLIQSVSESRKVKNRNRSDTSTTVLSNVGFQSIGYNRPSEDYHKNAVEGVRNPRVSVDRYSNAEVKPGTSHSSTPGLYLTSTNISSRRNADLRNSHMLSPISSTRRSFSSSRSSLQRSRSHSSDFDLFLEPAVPHETSSSSSPNLGKKHHFYTKFLPRRKSLSKNSATHRNTNEENAVSSISKMLHYPHYNTKHGHGTFSNGTNSSLFENSASKRQVSTHVLQDLITQNETLTKNDVMYLQDLMKNIPTLELNFHQFSNEERERILQNTWHVYCNICFALFKNHRIWNLNNKIEDLNRVLQFYIKMVQYNVKKKKHSSKSFASSSEQSRSSGLSSFAEESETPSFGNHPKSLTNSSSVLVNTLNSANKEVISTFLDNLEAFFLSALYVLENQIVFNYKDESVINNPVRRMCIIWKAFYENIFNDVLILNNPFDTYFDKQYNYAGGNKHASTNNASRSTDISIENILLRCFRDSIVLPYYQNFSHANEGGSASFMKFINEQDDIKTKEKLLLLQCLGVLKTIGSKDQNQLIIDELSTGLRMSMV